MLVLDRPNGKTWVQRHKAQMSRLHVVEGCCLHFICRLHTGVLVSMSVLFSVFSVAVGLDQVGAKIDILYLISDWMMFWKLNVPVCIKTLKGRTILHPEYRWKRHGIRRLSLLYLKCKLFTYQTHILLIKHVLSVTYGFDVSDTMCKFITKLTINYQCAKSAWIHVAM